MRDRTFRYIFGILSLLLIVGLIYKLTILPGGMILPGFILGGMALVGVLIVCLILTGIAKLIFKSRSFLTLFTIVSSIAFVIMHYYWYSPTLEIVVPKNYSGQVTLVSSNVRKNILMIDSNGIGYITKWTFEKTYTSPIVIDKDGNKLNNLCVGFNPSTFWAKGTATSTDFSGKIEYLSFEIVPLNKAGQKQYYNTNFTNHVDWSKLSKGK